MSKPIVVIVPGAWHRPKHYEQFTKKLQEASYEAHCIELPSFNSNPPHSSWDIDAETIRQVLLKYLDAGKDVSVVAHSFGGVAMSEGVKGLGKVAREKQGLNGGIVRLVYMTAMALPEGQSHMGQMQPHTPEEEEHLRRQPEGIMPNEYGALIVDREAARFAFYNRCDPKDTEEALDLLGTHPPGPLAVSATYTAYKKVPSTYIFCRNDHALLPSMQERIIAQGDGAFDVERCEEGHSPFLSNPAFVTGVIRRAAGEKV